MQQQTVILIVDDEQPMRQLLSVYLSQVGYRTEEAASGEEALTAIRKKRYQLILLDVMMKGMSGWDCCETIRQETTIPIIMLTAREATGDKVQGLRLGADDYITKPFDKEELLARVEAMLRRSQMHSQDASPSYNMLRHDGITVDVDKREVFYNEQRLSLTRREYDILYMLMKNKGQIFTRDDLLALIWTDRSVEDYRTVDTHVKNLREKLRAAGAPAHDVIKTVWGVGYKFQ
ncbi:response regulator transcription factor [Aneurinibacillus sp. Ricciae_BoGa-3]|uniref:response regulator transcription factor n=1 Tax=Aneurinibacillus sp. Ricciae_BoGa-3 TaxID=3022697 RepID=UPI002340BD0A|nr:response regulator transcription factor [Aneurinibacillus sp. Ricciae_BoGa-3]WCK52925.1 response regulator transcription factor [Aneurinibacillus sp. Ricciae_BoGa-3]